MKKRNQLVSALLAGMLISGMAGTTVWADNDQLNSADQVAVVAEAAAPAASEAAPETAAPAASPAPAASSSSQSASSASSGSASSQGSASSASDSSSVSEASSGSDTGSTGDTSASDTGSTGDTSSSDTGSTGDTSSSDTGSTGDTSSSDTGSTGDTSSSDTGSADDTSSTEEPGTAEDGNVDGEDPSAPTVSDVTAQEQADEEAAKKAQEEAAAKAAEEAKKKAADEAAAKEAQQKAASGSTGSSSGRSGSSASGGSSYSYGSGSSAYASSGSLIYNMILNRYSSLRIGFKQTDKVYAVTNAPSGILNIREGQSTTNRILGQMKNGALCYVLAEGSNGWVYVESGDVRGFVYSYYLKQGEEANAIVEATGESSMDEAYVLIDPTENNAYRYSLLTTMELNGGYNASRSAMIAFAEQFLGRPYVWGGEDLWNGCDCSGFVRGIYAKFGISLPRCSYEQCYTGTRIDAKDAKPGDLLFYARNGVVYHVLMYIGDGKAINAQSTATGIVISNVDYNKVCWATTYISDSYSSTQASTLTATGEKATNGDKASQQQIIDMLYRATDKEWQEYGFCRSVIMAQAILESGWLSFQSRDNGGMQPTDNNILGMNEELLNSLWQSPWTGKYVSRSVPQVVNGSIVYGYENMRAYEDIESCLEDYAAFKIGLHPELMGSTDVDKVIEVGLKGYATDGVYQETIKRVIDTYDLTRYDKMDAAGTTGISTGTVDTTSYSEDQLELIWAIVAQEDDASYDGALAVITTAMNRAEKNYGGYGTNALSQLTANGQFCYSASVSNPIYWQRRLNGNVPDFVKQAVSDCLEKGVRNHSYLSFRSTNNTGNRVQIGGNWYF